MRRNEILVLLLILVVAAGFRLYGLSWAPPGVYPDEAMNGNHAASLQDPFAALESVSVHFLGHTALALRVVPALIGILTVLGTYLLARRLFDNWGLAALAAFLMAVGFWHVHFSRIALGDIMAPFAAVWGFYYLLTALRSNHLWHWLVAGFSFGLGFYATTGLDLIPLAVIAVLLVYLWSLRRDFSHDKYWHTRHQLWGGFALMVGIMLLVILPIAGTLWDSPQLATQTSTHLAGQPVLSWAIMALLVVGLIRSFLKIGKSLRTHGHPSTVQILLLSWIFVGLLPGVIANNGAPNALQALVIAPAVFIIAGEALWWLYTWGQHWYGQRDLHPGEAHLVITIALISVLLAIGIAEGSRYFVDWARNPNTRAESGNALETAALLNSLPPNMLKYVVASRADAVMFLTNTASSAQQKAKNIYYLTRSQFDRHQYRAGALVVHLNP